MEPVSDSIKSLLLNLGKNTVVSRTSSPSTETSEVKKSSSDIPSESDFEKILKANLAPDASGQVSEEDLFAAAIPERITKLKGEEVAKKFSEELLLQKSTMQKSDGFIPSEDAAVAALNNLVSQSILTQEEADKVYSESFSAAQLDTNTDMLFDNRGGEGDTTIAVENMEAALIAMQLKIQSIDSGTEIPTARSLNSSDSITTTSLGSSSLATLISGGTITPKGTKFDGDGGFLFKPEAGDGKLAILASKGDMISSVMLKDIAGNIIEEGRFTSFGDDPSIKRAKYSFNQAGGSYPDNLVVEIMYKDGGVQNYEISDPSKRYD